MRRTSPRRFLFAVYGPEMNTFSGKDISVRILMGVSSRDIWVAVGGYTDGGTLILFY
jgi:hypothetical protein